jgi:LPXTG-motif cell wall-anchored protein
MTPTPTATPTPPVVLPETGLDAWGIAAVGAALALVVFGARRLRRAD